MTPKCFMIKELYKEKTYPQGNHRSFIGGLWEPLGRLQINMLKSYGLRPNHTLLDVGCGCFRLGVQAIPFLEEGNYYGIDIVESLIKDGIHKELREDLINNKKPTFLVNGNFKFTKFHTSFDFIIAQSVFTHLPLDRVKDCLVSARSVLKPSGRFFATIFEAPSREMTTYCEPYYVDPSFYQDMASDTGLKFKYIGEWNHPRKQKLIEFRL